MNLDNGSHWRDLVVGDLACVMKALRLYDLNVTIGLIAAIQSGQIVFTPLEVESGRFSLCVYHSLDDNNVPLDSVSCGSGCWSNARQWVPLEVRIMPPLFHPNIVSRALSCVAYYQSSIFVIHCCQV